MDEVWLSPKEVGDIENITKRTFLRRFRVSFYKTFRYVDSEKGGGKNGKKLEIALSSLSSDAQRRYLQKKYGGRELTPAELAEYFKIVVPPEKLKWPKVQSKVRLLAQCLSVPEGAERRSEEIREIAAAHGYSLATAYRLMERVKEGRPIVASTKNYGTQIKDLGITLRSWDERAADMAVKLIVGNKRRHQEGLALYSIIKDTAEAEGLRIGTYANFMQLNQKITPALKTYRDKGRQGLRQDVLPAIRRDATAYKAMECLIGDQHKADYYAIDSNGKVATLELFCWMDFRTQLVWGAVSYKHYNRYTVGQSLMHAVRWGLPKTCYTDWGKPEESTYITTLIEQLTGLGVATEQIEHLKAGQRHPQAKPIEGFFGILDRRIRNAQIPGYCKRLADPRESELQQKELTRLIKGGGLLRVQELTDTLVGELSRWNEHAFKARDRAPQDNGKSPLDIYTQETQQYPVHTLSDDTLDYIFLPRRELMIRRCQVGFQHEHLGKKVYYDRALADYQGTRAEVRYDPYDPSQVWVFVDGKLICVADEWGMVNPKIPEQVEAKRAEQKALSDQVRATYRKYAPPVTPVRRINKHEKEAREVKKVTELRIRKTSLEMDMQAEGSGLKAQGGGDPLAAFRARFHPGARKQEEPAPYKPLFKLSMKQLQED